MQRRLHQVKIATEKAEGARILRKLPAMTMVSLWFVRMSERVVHLLVWKH